MATMIEFLVRLQDMASGPLMKFSQNSQSTFAKLENSISKTQQKFNVLGMNISQIDSKLDQLRKTREISFDRSQINRINKEIDTLQSKKDRLEGTSSRSGFGGLGGYLGIASLAYIGKDIMQAGIERQMNLTSLQTMLGSQPGLMVNNQLKQFAQKSMYGNEVFEEGKLMAGSGVKAGNILPVLSMIGDLANGSKERMKSIALAFSEASSTGYLTGRQELMMRTALFNPLESLSKITGKNGGDLDKDMAHHKISIGLLVKAMEYATGPLGRWHNSMKNLQDKDSGKWVTFMGTLSMKMGDLGLAIMPVVGMFASLGNSFLTNTPLIYGVATAIGAMTAAWILYTAWTERAAIWQGILAAAAYWPLVLIGAIAGGIGYLIAKNGEYGDSTEDTADRINKTFTTLQLSLERIGYWAQLAWLHVASFFERIRNVLVANSPSAVWKALTGETESGKAIDKLQMQHMWREINEMNGLDDKGNPKKKGKSPGDILTGNGTGGYVFTGGVNGGTIGGSTTGGITGGGVRNITINVAKFGEKFEIHTANIKEGVHELEEMMRDMFLRTINSAATVMQ